jgi:hypothetical protein
MRGNIVAAAAVFGIAFVLACMLVVLGVGRAIENAGGRIAEAVAEHGQLTRNAGQQVGSPIQTGLEGLNATVKEHAQAMRSAGQAIQSAGNSIESAGQAISAPNVTMRGPVPVTAEQPVSIRGPSQGGSLPVDVEMGQEDKKQD